MAFSKIAAENLGGSALPAIGGGNLTGITTGKIGQVVGNNSVSKYSTSSTSFTSVYSAPSITPSATSSKILISWHCSLVVLSNTSNLGHIRLSRFIDGGSEAQIHDGGHNSSMFTYKADANQQGYGLSFEILDSPSTTGALTYYVQHKTDNTGMTMYTNQNQGGQGGNMFMVLKEVLA
mgnify:CR=1 FL=1|tara:strand:- start:260 stop:793 length:534 start_codon:yes stop_codon:yes gene_type:complete